jgi:ribosome maturation factor RimP
VYLFVHEGLVLYSRFETKARATTGTWARAHVLFRSAGATVDAEGLVRPVVESAGLELVDVAMQREQGGRRILRVTVDREAGLDLETVSKVSERISRRLDLEGFDPGPYSLEVSSPGVERPLREPRDFSRHVGERVTMKTSRPVEGSKNLAGRLVEAGPDRVRIATEAGERAVAYEDIASARTMVDWNEELARKPGPRAREGDKR